MRRAVDGVNEGAVTFLSLRRQGAMVAVDLVLDAPEPCAGVVALSGFVMCVEDWARKLQSEKGAARAPAPRPRGPHDPLLHGALAARPAPDERRAGHVPAARAATVAGPRRRPPSWPSSPGCFSVCAAHWPI